MVPPAVFMVIMTSEVVSMFVFEMVIVPAAVQTNVPFLADATASVLNVAAPAAVIVALPLHRSSVPPVAVTLRAHVPLVEPLRVTVPLLVCVVATWGVAIPEVPVYVRVFAVVAPSSNAESDVGAPPAPPPRSTWLVASTADEVRVVALLK